MSTLLLSEHTCFVGGLYHFDKIKLIVKGKKIVNKVKNIFVALVIFASMGCAATEKYVVEVYKPDKASGFERRSF